MNALATLERDILFWIQENLRCAALTPPLKFITLLGNAGLFWIGLTLLLLCFKKTRRAGICSAAAILLTFLVVNCAIKPIAARMRPYERFRDLTILVGRQSDFSFPSGHAANSFAGAWALYRTARKRLGVPALILAALIAFSRLYVGVHYPTDVLAGAAIGIICSEIALRLARKYLIPRIMRKSRKGRASRKGRVSGR